MRDLDELLTGGVADAAADAVDSTPDLAALRHRGARRRRLRRTALAGLAAAAVAVVIGLAQLPGHDRAEPSDPGPSPTDLPTPKMSADEIIDHRRAEVEFVVVSPDDPDIRAVGWWLGDRHAIAVTDDGFESRHTVRGRLGSAKPLGRVGFLIERWAKPPQLLATDGTLSEVEVDRTPWPAEPAEVVVGIQGSGVPYAGWVAVDPVTLAGHRVPVPEDVHELHQAADGRLHAIVNPGYGASPGYLWSDDGGLNWQRHPLPDQLGDLYFVVPSASAATLAFGETSDSYRSPVIDALHVSRDGGATWQRIEPASSEGAVPPAAEAYQVAVLPDGSFLTHSTPSNGEDAGFYLGEDGRAFVRVDSGPPFDDAAHRPDLVTFDVRSDGVAIYAGASKRLYRSTDNGVTWEEVQTR
ncbi:WD40/YVTN/BNR-like repeat-containing protein [Nocardioides speluncae]|uniref:WD40/YVTN/BNR-like repeat-containing protein n=1 Tax=Nocardioides speluncae TaxID=2670337 RepID=UPI000D6862BE|nr:sialidase family protein [Nocardioides speluncae]